MPTRDSVLIQPSGSAVGIIYDFAPGLQYDETGLSTTVLVLTSGFCAQDYVEPLGSLSVEVCVTSWMSIIICVITSLTQENHYCEPRIQNVVVLTTVAEEPDAIEAPVTTVLVVMTCTEVYSVESLIPISVEFDIRFNIWQRTKTGIIMIGDPPRRSSA